MSSERIGGLRARIAAEAARLGDLRRGVDLLGGEAIELGTRVDDDRR